MVNTKIVIRKDTDSECFSLENDSIISAHINKPCDPSLSELAIGTLEAVLRISGFVEGFAPADYPDGMESADGQTIYCRDADTSVLEMMQYGYDALVYTNDLLVGTFYVKTVVRTGADAYTLTAQNWAGVLDDYTHYGARRGTSGAAAFAMFAISDFFTSLPNSFLRTKISSRLSFSADLADIHVISCYIPKGTIREQLQSFLFAYGISMIENEAGYIRGTILSSSPTRELPRDTLYAGGSVETAEQPYSITVVEHTFSENPNTEESAWELLFDNTEHGSASYIYAIEWDGLPMSHLKIDQNVISYESYVFSTTVTGRHKVYGKRVLDATRELTEYNKNGTIGVEIRADTYSITPLTSSSIMRRLKSFYFADRRVIKQDYVWNGEVNGQSYTITNAFGEESSGMLADSTIDLSGVTKASAIFHDNFEPYNPRPFSHTVVLTGSGTWTVPDGVEAINVVLVGGGSGGSSGLKGQNGKSVKHGFSGTDWTNNGGAAGACGNGGKIRTITVNDPAESYTYSCGAGGAGGAVCSSTSKRNEGKPGGNTIFGPYSSAYGAEDSSGIENQITHAIYGAKLGSTIADIAEQGANSYYTYAFPVTSFYYDNGILKLRESPCRQPAKTGSTFVTHDSQYKYTFTPYNGCPGSSAVNVKGGSGTATKWKTTGESVQLGNGGAGATPSVPGLSPLSTGLPLYGWGGGGGHGGGAGGNAGFLYTGSKDDSSFDKFMVNGTAGKGGNGGAGGAGAPGCIIIYY